MKKLVDIVCSSTPYGEMYTGNDLTGSVVINDGKLEGLVYDDGTSFFTFGVVDEENIKVYVSTNHDRRLPRVYSGTSINGKKYFGDKAIANRFAEIPCEECKVNLLNPERHRDYSSDEIERLEELVKLRKKLLGNESEVLYENIFNNEIDKSNTL